jgi:DnaK suppressor protein
VTPLSVWIAARAIRAFTALDWFCKLYVLASAKNMCLGGAGMNKRELKKFRNILERKRDTMVHQGSRKAYWENMGNTRHGDFVDQASDDNEVHVNIRLRQTDAKLLRAIEAAIARIENGSYGICTQCEEEISAARLQAVPWTSVCVACKEKKTA